MFNGQMTGQFRLHPGALGEKSPQERATNMERALADRNRSVSGGLHDGQSLTVLYAFF